MSTPNPFRWDCNKQGCFNLFKRPKLDVFSESFYGKINFGDVDGIVEINGFALLLEWKSSRRIPQGQHIMFKRLTRTKLITVFVVIGDATTMKTSELMIYSKGTSTEWRKADLGVVRSYISAWNRWALQQKRPSEIK